MFALAFAQEAATALAPAIVVAPAVPDAWNQLLSTIIVGFLIPAVGYAGVLARAWVKSKTAKIKNDELRAAADYAMQRLDRIVTNTVKEIEQAKSTMDKGPLTKEQKKQLLTIAFNRVKAQVHEDVIQAVNQVVKDSDRYIVTKIEAAVGDLKQAKVSVETTQR
jgi:uncharacterized membrane protein YheB (UPF0754 family)